MAPREHARSLRAPVRLAASAIAVAAALLAGVASAQPAAPASPPGLAPLAPPRVSKDAGLPYYYDDAGTLRWRQELAYDADRPIPEGYAIRRRPPRWALVTGAVTFGTLYAASFVTGIVGVASNGLNSYGRSNVLMIVPGVGPFVSAALFPERGNTTTLGLFVGDGIAQTLGLGLFVYSLVAKEMYLERIQVLPELRVGLGTSSLRWSF